MKVLHIGKYFYPVRGGIETYLYYLTKGLKAKDDIEQLDVLVSNTNIRTEFDNYEGIDLIRAGKWDQPFSAPICPAFFKYIKKDYYDIIHLHLPNPMAIITCLWKKMQRTKFVVSYHSDIIRQQFLFSFYKKYIIKFLEKTSAILVATPHHIEYSPILPRFASKTYVVPFGIDWENYQLNEREKNQVLELKEKLSPEGYPIILFVGRLVYYKGLEYLIEAVRGEKLKLIIVGNGPYYPILKLKTEGMDNVILAGEVSDVNLKFYYHASDIFVLPSISRAEAFGIVQLEAMACGKPVISTNLDTGVSWVNKNEKTGIIVEKENVEALKEAIVYLAQNPKIRENLGTAGIQRVKEEFNLQQMIDKTYQVYQKVLNRK